MLAPTAHTTGWQQPARRIDLQLPECFRARNHMAIAAGQSFMQMQEALKCGTSCGSCVPEVKRMIAVKVEAAWKPYLQQGWRAGRR